MGFTKSVTITFFSNLLLFFLSIINTTVLSRVLGPEGKGVVDVANNFLSFATLILGMGFAASTVFFLGKKKDALNAIIGNNIVVALVSSLVLIPFYFLHLHFHFKFLAGVSNIQMLAVLVTVPLVNFKSAMINVLLGLQDMVEYNRINVIDKILSLVLLIIFLLIAVNPTAAIVSILIGTLAICLLQIYILILKRKQAPRVERGLMKDMFGYGLKAQFGNIVQKLNYRLDVFIVNYYLPIDQVGIYGIAVALGETLWGVSGSIATVVFPIASSSTDKKGMMTFTNQITRVSLTLIAGFSVILAFISKPLILVWFGRDFITATGALLWLLPGISIFSVSNILANYLAGVGLVEKNIYSSIMSGVVTVVLDIILIPRIGIIGASIATSLSYIVFTLMTIIFYINYTHARWQDILILKKSDMGQIIRFIKSRLRK
ncbi:oligosaccharide flippase family protein [Desulfitobacterium sp. AusDCA]|uniref:oligosaccharide flippase family protein n=1 Tax=Desulfitobacterium sp. AusDCA TaxID=3240383 RepID=UPI003DA7022A